MAAITTPEEVLEVTGAAVTAEHIAQATGVISVVTGVDFDTDPLPYIARDVRTLKTAVIWQAPFVKETPEIVAQAGNLASASTNGVSVTYRSDAGPLAGLVAPLAAHALKRLSWRGSRTVRMVPSKRSIPRAQTLVVDGSDGEWKPLR